MTFKVPQGKPIQRPDGRWTIDMRLPRITPFAVTGTYSPATAVRATHAMQRYAAGPMGMLEAAVLSKVIGTSGIKQSLIDQFDKIEEQEIAEEIYYGTIDSWAKPMTILADDGFTQMMLAAALTAPTNPLLPDEVIAPSGTIFFQNAILMTPLFETLRGVKGVDDFFVDIFKELPIRAMHWGEMNYNGLGIHLLLDGPTAFEYEEKSERGNSPNNPLNPIESYNALSQATFSIALYETDQEPHPTTQKAIALMRALKAIADSPISEARKAAPIKRRKGSKHKPIDVTGITTISLRKKEYGRNELDAATGRKQRAHWVRGHWRNQWFPKSEENRPLWIDGHSKGNPQLGVVTNPRVYLAKG